MYPARLTVHIGGCLVAALLIARTVLTWLDGNTAILHLALLAMLTAIPAWLLSTPHATENDARAAMRWAVLFGLLCVAALPTFGRDFWLYLAQGRHAALGANVYTEPMSPAAIAGVPLNDTAIGLTMTYGPLWVVISRALSTIAEGRLVWEFALYKLLFFAAWLFVIWQLVRSMEAATDRWRAVLVLGWLPGSLLNAVADAHNDTVFVALLTIWLVDQRLGTMGLIASVLMKYTTAPLIALAAVAAIRQRSFAVLAGLVVGAGLVAAILAVYWQEGALIAGLSRNRLLLFYTPVSLIQHLGLPDPIEPIVVLAWRAILAGVVLAYGVSYWRQPTASAFAGWVTVTLFAVVMASPYMFPHYLLWVLPSLLLSRDRLLMMAVGPLLVLLPFVQVVRRIAPLALYSHRRLTLGLWVGVLLCWVGVWLVRRYGERTHTSRR